MVAVPGFQDERAELARDSVWGALISFPEDVRLLLAAVLIDVVLPIICQGDDVEPRLPGFRNDAYSSVVTSVIFT